jgi:hypothetical protein
MKNALRFGESSMHKTTLLLSFLLLCWPCLVVAQGLAEAQAAPGGEAQAQPQHVAQAVSGKPVGEKGPVRFGARLGLNGTNMNFNQGFPKPAVPVETTWKLGASAGFFWQLPLSKSFALQQEYLLSQLGGTVESTGTTYQLRYLSLPVLLQYRSRSKLAFTVGPQFDLLLQAKARVNGTTTTITHDTEERSIGAVAGLEFYVTESFSLQVRYMQGLNHIGIGQRSDVQEFKHQVMQVATAIRL